MRHKIVADAWLCMYLEHCHCVAQQHLRTVMSEGIGDVARVMSLCRYEMSALALTYTLSWLAS